MQVQKAEEYCMYSRFLNRTDEGKDPLPAADELFRGSMAISGQEAAEAGPTCVRRW